MKAFAVVAATTAGVVLTVSSAFTAASDAATAATEHGCQSGYVCLYPGAGWNNDTPTQSWNTYGYHNLSNTSGTHRFFNNQTKNYAAYACSGYNGTGQVLFGENHGYVDQDFKPVNSVVLASNTNVPSNC